MKKKIISILELSKKIALLRKKNKNIALCHGVFDLLHPGHISHLNQAKKLADILVVSLTADDKVSKGPGSSAERRSLSGARPGVLCRRYRPRSIRGWPRKDPPHHR